MPTKDSNYIPKAMPFTKALKFFTAKKRRGFESFDYDDINPKTHAIAFTVAKTTGYNVLDTMYTGLQATMVNGGTYNDFKKSVVQDLKKQGWWGRHTMVNPKTGELVNAQLGSSRRLKTIFNTNIKSSYSAGRWLEIENTKKATGEEVYIEYMAVLDGKERAEHASKDGIILPASDPFWEQWYPPNGWRCRCSVSTMTQSVMEAEGLKPSTRPSTPNHNIVNRKTGEVITTPKGLDPSFNFNIGKEWLKPYVPEFSGFEVIGNVPSVRRFFAKNDLNLLPENKSPEFYAMAFLRNFGVRNLNQVATFTDKTGMDIIISRELLSDSKGILKADKNNRGLYMNVLADTIKNPDRIEKYLDKEKKVRRRYTKGLAVGKKKIGFSVFDWDVKNKKWAGQTVFHTKTSYPKSQPKGMILYEKK